jgi:short-subunit dehydrogenase
MPAPEKAAVWHMIYLFKSMKCGFPFWLLVFCFSVSCNSCKCQLLQDSLSTPHDYALVAGGSKGIGYGIAEALAKRGYNLILIARHEHGLSVAEKALKGKFGVEVKTIVKDLANENSAEEIAAWCIGHNIRLKVLCNVAGMGGSRDYLSLTLDSLRYMVNLNIESCMALTLKLLPLLESNSPSYVLNVSSMAGLAPIPTKNMYAATKSAVLFFSYGLRYQLKEKRISVSCLAPGPVFTKPSIIADTRKNLGWVGMKMALSPGKVGEVAVRKMLHGKMLITPGTLAKISSVLVRVLPKRITTSLYYHQAKRRNKKR